MGPPQYAVIMFLSDNTYSEVPITWLVDDDQFCYWPNSTRNISSMMMRAVPPEPKTWDKYAVRVEGKYESLQQARRKAIDSECGTTTDDEHLGKGKRKRKKSRKTRSPSVSSSHSEGDCEQLDIPTPPPGLTSSNPLNEDVIMEDEFIITDADITIVDRTTLLDGYEPVSMASSSTSGCTTPRTSCSDLVSAAGPICSGSSTSRNLQSANLDKIYNICCNMHMQLLSIESRLSKLENNGKIECPTANDEALKKCIELLPLQDVERLKEFDTLLKDDAAMGAKYKLLRKLM